MFLGHSCIVPISNDKIFPFLVLNYLNISHRTSIGVVTATNKERHQRWCRQKFAFAGNKHSPKKEQKKIHSSQLELGNFFITEAESILNRLSKKLSWGRNAPPGRQ